MTHATAPEGAQKLKHGITLIDLVMLGAGTAIGSSVFTVMGPAAEVGGSGMLIALLIAALPMVVFGMVYAYMASAVPRTAASYEWQREFTSPVVAFAIVWMRILSNAVVMTLLARTLVNYLSMAVPLPASLTMFGLFAAVFGLNYFGVAIAARAQTILMLGLLVVFAVFVGAGAPNVDPVAVFVDAAGGGWGAILAAVPLMISLFLGIETATEVGEEVKNPKVTVPLGLILAMILTAVVYLSICLTALGLVGPVRLAASAAPLLTAAEAALGGLAKPLIVTAAVFALVKSMNAVFLVYARFLYAMGRSGVLPSSLAKVHPRWGTPHVATLTAFGLTCMGLFLPSSLLFLLLAVNVPTMGKYLGSCLAAYVVADRRPDIHSQAHLRFPAGLVKTLSVIGVIAAVVIALLGLGSDWRPYVLLSAWLALGLAYYVWTQRGRATA